MCVYDKPRPLASPGDLGQARMPKLLAETEAYQRFPLPKTGVNT